MARKRPGARQRRRDRAARIRARLTELTLLLSECYIKTDTFFTTPRDSFLIAFYEKA